MVIVLQLELHLCQHQINLLKWGKKTFSMSAAAFVCQPFVCATFVDNHLLKKL